MTNSNTLSTRPPPIAHGAFVQSTIAKGSRIVRSAGAVVCSLFDAIADLANSFLRAHAISISYSTLAALDDRTLSDMGLRREELTVAAVHSVDNPDMDYRKRAF